MRSIDELRARLKNNGVSEEEDSLNEELVPLGLTDRGDGLIESSHIELDRFSTVLITGAEGSGYKETNKALLELLTSTYPYSKYIYINQKGDWWDKTARKTNEVVYRGSQAFLKIASVLVELTKRRRLFKEKGVESIIEYRMKHDADLPRIFLIIDSMDRLLKNLNKVDKEFINYVLMIIGRNSKSLGFHIIATASDLSDLDYLDYLNDETYTLLFSHRNIYQNINCLDLYKELNALDRGEYLINIDEAHGSKWFMHLP